MDDTQHVLAGGGELGERMRAIDWSQTPLGPVEAWPQSLKTCVRIILTSRQPMFVWWGDQLINLYNDAYKAIVGGKHPEALGQPAAVVWREIWDQVGPRAATAMQTNVGTYDEALLLIMERYGYPEETYYTFSYSPVPDDAGGAGGIICANTDDTDRIVSDRQLTLLRELAARMIAARTVDDAIGTGCAALHANPRDLPFAMVYMPAAASELALAGAAGITADTAAALAGVLRDGAREAIATGEPRVIDVPTGLALPTGAWTEPPRQLAVLPLPMTAVAQAGVLVVGLNRYRRFDDGYRGFLSLVAGQLAASISTADAYASERKRAEALAALDRAKTAFFSNISHEFRTPLTLMLGPQEDALRGAAPVLAGAALESVHRNTLRLLKLVNTLLDFSRMEAGAMRALFRPTDLAGQTRTLASTFESAIARGGLAFEVDCPPLAEPIFIDRDMWEKIVLNLLSNAFKFTLHGGIRVALHDDGARAVLEVADTGGGIPAAELPRLFQRFHRIEGTPSRSYEGSGIGLALVHELVEQHGGQITVASELGRGTTFTVAIPHGSAHLPADRLAPAGDDATATATAAGAAHVSEAARWLPGAAQAVALPVASEVSDGPTRGRHRGARILVADDNADMRGYVTGLLRGAGWRVLEATDGAQALALARTEQPDLVLTDVMMPSLDGFGLLASLRNDPATHAMPLIILSARAGDEARVDGLHAGADDYLVKPFSANELIARVSTHLQLASLRVAAAAAGEQLRSLFMQSPLSIALLTGPNHRYELANPRYLEMVQKTDIVGRDIGDVFPEIIGTPLMAVFDEVYRTGEPFVTDAFEVTLVRGGRPERCVFQFNLAPTRDGLGEVTGMLASAVEITPLYRARADAEAANRAKDEFLAMLGHELRNPLAPIVTALQLIKLRGSDPATRKEHTIIERQTEHLIRLVDDLLDVSRITRGKIELRKERVELAEVVAKAIEIASPLIESRRHVLDIDVRPRGLEVEGDVVRLAQVVSNLLTNAAKYTEVGGRITVVATARDHGVELAVQDTGIGIDPEMLPHIFETFVQARQAIDRAQGGLGLGLSIVRSLIHLHGGTVTADSAGRGHGTRFVVWLPALSATVEPEPAAIAASPAAASEHGLRVLVVDDNEDAAALLTEYIQRLGHTVAVANDGPSALRTAAQFAPDVGLLDIGLPVMDGYELARRLREDLPARPLKLIAVTGYGASSDRTRSAEAGFDEHLVKPIDLKRLNALLAELQHS